MLDLKWGHVVGAVIISRSMWDLIPQEYHEGLLEIAQKTENLARATGQNREQVLHVMQEHGLKIQHLNQEQKNTWIEFTKSFYPHLRGTLVPEEIFDRALRLKKEIEDQKGNSYQF